MDQKRCPLFIMTPQSYHKQSDECIESKCAWWCEWINRCAMTAAVSALEDGLFDVAKSHK